MMTTKRHAPALAVMTLIGILFSSVGPAAAARIDDVDQPGICYVCHSDVQEQADEAHVHSIFGVGECSACHNPHAARHAQLLNADGRSLCYTCHEDFEEKATVAAPHAPVADGDCVLCHDAHASANPNQLLAPMVEQCAQCHVDVRRWESATVVHAPVEGGECSSCHDPHGSENVGLLPASVQETCFQCHAADASFNRVHRSASIAQSDCTTCHDPHASGREGLLRTNQHEPFASGSCETCHGGLSDTSSFEVAEVQKLCERCHRDAVEFRTSTYTHVLDTDESCAACHNPHASNVSALLSNSTDVMCQQCHFEGPGFEKAKAEYLTHASMDCAECHTPHGAENVLYLKDSDGDFCATCHENAHRVSHPVGPEVIDARTGESVTCLSCHQLHGADFDFYLPLDPTRELCLQCHRR